MLLKVALALVSVAAAIAALSKPVIVEVNQPAPTETPAPQIDATTPDIAGCSLVKSTTYPLGLYLCPTPEATPGEGYPAP